ncbi:hypothetical protein [Pontibacter burrus]|uniref:Uncharacterized protein n=1 Tax=Pontibacter burrus TaxID=2704466 RepID=A0A6B3LWW5_9BACT|nr:hypothetical protein [Pontibacter burrus]NEM99435.1 hypothetical protein [Pontibacter burrus]
MKHLKKFLTRLQTFELNPIQRRVVTGPYGHQEVRSYDLRHETHYDEAAVFKSELRLLSQLAALDLLPLHRPQLQLVLGQMTELEDHFRAFWVSFHNHAPDYGQAELPATSTSSACPNCLSCATCNPSRSA